MQSKFIWYSPNIDPNFPFSRVTGVIRRYVRKKLKQTKYVVICYKSKTQKNIYYYNGKCIAILSFKEKKKKMRGNLQFLYYFFFITKYNIQLYNYTTIAARLIFIPSRVHCLNRSQKYQSKRIIKKREKFNIKMKDPW